MRPSARELFGRLVVPGQGSPDTRRRARVSELSEPARQVADRFVAARLLVADRDLATREPVVEVAHEALLANWQRLRGWLEADRRWLAQLHHLATASRAWSESGQVDGELYRGARLESVVEALPEHGGELSEDERAFVDASRHARDAVRERELRANRRLRRLLAAVAVVLVLALVAGVIALTQRRGADRSRRGAEITTLATRSLALRSSQRDVAALLAVEAERLRPDAESKSALFGSFSGDPGFMGYHRFDGILVIGAVIPASNSAIIGTGSGKLGADNPPMRRVDLATGELGPPFDPMGPHDHGSFRLAVSANGAVAAEYTYQFIDGVYQPARLAMFDVAFGKMIGKPIPLSTDGKESNFTLAVNADGSPVAVAGGRMGLARVFAVADGRLLATIPPAADMVASADGRDTSSAAWAPDGRLYVGSSGTHLRVFNPSTFNLDRDITVPVYATGGLLKFSDDGSFVVSRGVIERDDGSQAGSAARINLSDGTVAWLIGPDEFGFGNCGSIALSVPEDRVWCGDYFGVIRSRSLTTGALDGTTIEHQRGSLSSLDLVETEGGRYLVSMGNNSASIGRWRVDGSGPISRKIAPGHDYARYSPNGQWMLLEVPPNDRTDGYTPSLWNASTDQQIAELPTHSVAMAVWLGDGRLATLSEGGRLHVVNPQTGVASDAVIKLDPDFNVSAAVGGAHLAFGYGDGHVDVFDADTGARSVRLQLVNPFKTFQPPVNGIAASADGSRIYITGTGLYEFDAVDGHEVRRTEDTQIVSVAVRGGSPIAVGYIDGSIGLLDPADLSLRRTLPGARAVAPTLRYSADGRLLLATAYDNTMSIYDVTTGQRFGDPVSIAATDADLRPDGREVAVPNLDGSGITLWSLDPATMTKAACQIAGRNLTHAEWDTYLGHLGPYRKTCPDFPAG
jgi:WD40 repeat protein